MPTLEERIAILEQRLDASTLALVPPIQIGELLDVPTAGSQLAAAWAQEATGRIVHRFATVAARDAQYPAAVAGTGAVCFTRDTNTLWVVDTTPAWAKIRMGVYGTEFYQVRPNSDTTISGTSVFIPVNGAAIALPARAEAGWLFLSATFHFTLDAPSNGLCYVAFSITGNAPMLEPIYHLENVAQDTSHTMTLLVPGRAGVNYTAYLMAHRAITGSGTGTPRITAADTSFQVIRYVP